MPLVEPERCLLLAVRPEGANHQWRKNPPGELSIDPVADERFVRLRLLAQSTLVIAGTLSTPERKETMSSRENYAPGPAAGAEVRKDGDDWTLILVRELRHPPAKVWQALTEPAQLREWAPFDVDRSLAAVGAAKLSTVGTPTPQISETTVTRADAPKLLEY